MADNVGSEMVNQVTDSKVPLSSYKIAHIQAKPKG